MKIALRIEYNKKENTIAVIGFDNNRFECFGFGTFLTDIDPKEVEIKKDALEILLA